MDDDANAPTMHAMYTYMYIYTYIVVKKENRALPHTYWDFFLFQNKDALSWKMLPHRIHSTLYMYIYLYKLAECSVCFIVECVLYKYFVHISRM